MSEPKVRGDAETVVVVIERRLATRVMKVRGNFGNMTSTCGSNVRFVEGAKRDRIGQDQPERVE